jgi:hypothetical protein
MSAAETSGGTVVVVTTVVGTVGSTAAFATFVTGIQTPIKITADKTRIILRIVLQCSANKYTALVLPSSTQTKIVWVRLGVTPRYFLSMPLSIVYHKAPVKQNLKKPVFKGFIG